MFGSPIKGRPPDYNNVGNSSTLLIWELLEEPDQDVTGAAGSARATGAIDTLGYPFVANDVNGCTFAEFSFGEIG